jgi:3-oxoacyl-[acyl-carrier protein] reductase
MNTNTQKLSGKVAIVTGASKGIGAAIATHLAAAGASVVVNYSTSKEGADRIVDLIAKRGGTALAVQANVAKQADIDRLFAATHTAFGRLDILVNNAGIFEFARLEELTTDHFHRQFDVNVLGLLLSSQKAAESFGDEGGSIINISSVVAVSPQAGSSVYGATKAAVDGITKSLAKELGARKIRVNSLNPGMVETEGFHAAGFAGGEMQKAIEAETPLGRIGQPDDVGPVAVFLASDDSRWITGETLLVSGGFR